MQKFKIGWGWNRWQWALACDEKTCWLAGLGPSGRWRRDSERKKGVGTGENVFVSCCIIAITARIPDVINFAIVHSLVHYPLVDAIEET